MPTATQLQPTTNTPTTPMSIRVYNTLSKKKETFEPVTPGKVGIYLCGPTVYKPSHIGHMVGPVIFDAIKRYLVYNGYEVTWVVNITDVDDKLIAEASKRGISMAQVAEEMTADYLHNLSLLGVDQIDKMPKATDCMDEIIQFIADLITKDFAYAADGDVFFDVAKDREYGKLSNRSPDEQQGEGGEAAARKRSPGDFALWKSAKPGEPSWDSPWGKGRPGWHIECSAMSRQILGETFDIHGGGLDLMFPHHENEIAQSECCHGKPMVKYWLHNGLMQSAEQTGKVGGRQTREREVEPEIDLQAQIEGKTSKSKKAESFRDLLEKLGVDASIVRFYLLATHYRSPFYLSNERVQEAADSAKSFERFFERYERVSGESFYELKQAARRTDGEFDPGDNPLLREVHARRSGFLAKMDDDFNTGAAVSELFELLRALNKHIDQHKLEESSRDAAQVESLKRGVAALRELTALLGIFREPPAKSGGDDALVGKLMELMISLRAEARQNKDFATADRIRNGLTEIGITLEDRKEGTLWRVE
ncbi:MAG: cysteine--tRNA ligase [Pirellulaceae bacterium]